MRDRQVGTLELFAIAPGGSSSTIGNNHMPSVSDDDDRYLAFLGVVPGSIGGPHASLRDRNSGVTIQVSASQSGSLDEDSYEVALSADGSTVVYLGSLGTLASQRKYDDATEVTTTLLGPGISVDGTLSIDRMGSRLAVAMNVKLLPEDVDDRLDVYVLDLATGVLDARQPPHHGHGAAGASLVPQSLARRPLAGFHCARQRLGAHPSGRQRERIPA